MILPDKYITPSESLVGIGAFLLDVISKKSITTDKLWSDFNKKYIESKIIKYPPTFNKFLYTLEVLYLMGTINYNEKGEIFNENFKN
ncbi:ABC-three component system middle component 6 [Cetobacterium sp. 2G large]|uniref:ABC-three component system middle component 6 n=1 Tax=Cetobacterium sp. 2G large TaxID=2759680 RepID=UPI00163D0432|nr:ABC-three component system middle component 6 [Cetobacterium sp. 2G large]MBC2854714.1 hypothetical protein [Cetobacterium sp. 2G large]